MKKVEVSPALARKVAANTAAISDTREDICYIVDGDQSEVTIPSGSIFRLINSTVTGRSDGLYTSAAAIPASTSIDATYFNESAPLSGGVSNLLNSNIGTLSNLNTSNKTDIVTALNEVNNKNNVSLINTGITGMVCYKSTGGIVWLTFLQSGSTSKSGAWVSLGTLPSGVRPRDTYRMAGWDNYSDESMMCRVNSSGTVEGYYAGNKSRQLCFSVSYPCA